jgi:hypothetical protein
MIRALNHLTTPTPAQLWLLRAGPIAAVQRSLSKFDSPPEAGGQPNKRAGVIR